jgi:hypothetical protein
MGIYFILLIAVLFFLVLGRVKGFESAYASLFAVLALFAGFRYMVGIDYPQYSNLFDYVKNGSLFVTKELGFGFFLNLLVVIGGTAQLFFLIFAVLTQYYTYKAIQKNSVNQEMSILIYFCILSFYLFSFNGVRQSLAGAVFLYAIWFIQTSDLKRYSIYIFVAAIFAHLSVIFYYPVYWVIKKHYSTIFKILLLVLAVAFGFMIDKLIAMTPYAVYVGDDKSFDVRIDAKIYAFLLLGIFLELIRRRFDKTELSNILFNFNFLSVFVLLMLIFQNNSALILLLKRLHNYILATYIFLIPMILETLEYKSKKISSYAFYMLFILLYILTIVAIGVRIQIIPYSLNFQIF